MLPIGIAGRVGSGKTTFANYLLDYLPMAYILPFANPIKKFALDLGWDGKKNEKGRRLLQLLGTEIGRECIDPNIWINHWSDCTLRPMHIGVKYFIADDVRFRNEAKAINGTGFTFFITGRSNKTVDDSHLSERGLFIDDCNHTIYNNGTLVDLSIKAKEWANKIKEFDPDD